MGTIIGTALSALVVEIDREVPCIYHIIANTIVLIKLTYYHHNVINVINLDALLLRIWRLANQSFYGCEECTH
jgi:hypothetical protein